MSSSKTENAGRSPSWSANDFLEQYEKLGIPHFQRGLVWGPNPVSLLLESQIQFRYSWNHYFMRRHAVSLFCGNRTIQ